MKFDFAKAANAIIPSLSNSWKQAVAGAGIGFVFSGFTIGGAVTGAILGGLSNAAVEIAAAGKGAPAVK